MARMTDGGKESRVMVFLFGCELASLAFAIAWVLK